MNYQSQEQKMPLNQQLCGAAGSECPPLLMALVNSPLYEHTPF